MKKEYSTPAIDFESFELSQSIAGDCTTISLGPAATICPVQLDDGMVILNDKMMGCAITGPEADDLICYHAPSDDSTVFSS